MEEESQEGEGETGCGMLVIVIELRVEGRKLNTQPGLCCRVVIVDIKTAYHRGKERVI